MSEEYWEEPDAELEAESYYAGKEGHHEGVYETRDETGRRVILFDERVRLFREALTAADGNVSRAARMCGMSPEAARYLVRRYSDLQTVVEEAKQLAAERASAVLRPWEVLAPKAQRRLEEALDAERVRITPGGDVVKTPDWKTRLAAAREIMDRTFGKPVTTAQVEVATKTGPTLEPELAQRAMVASLVRGLSPVEAVEWVRAHPDEAEAMVRAVATLAAGAAAGALPIGREVGPEARQEAGQEAGPVSSKEDG